MEEFQRPCCIRGYHIYKDVWEAAVGEVLVCVRELDNAADRYAVAVKKERVVIGQLPHKLSRVCSRMEDIAGEAFSRKEKTELDSMLT